jgi:hypothetical protein
MAVVFSENITPETLLVQQLATGKADYNYKKAREFLASGEFDEAYSCFLKAIKLRNDIETPTFKKYFEVVVSRFLSYRHSINNLLLKISLMDEKFAELQGKNADLEAQNIKQKGENNLLKKNLAQLAKRNELVKGENIQLKIKLAKLDKSTVIGNEEFIQLKAELEKSLQKTNFLDSIITQLQTKVLSQNQTLLMQEEMLVKMRKQKWYQRIFSYN